MSFILDALKKSESERQRQSGPALFEVKVAPPRSRFAGWAAAIAALLAVNFIVVGFVLWRGSASRAAASAAAAHSGGVPTATPEAPGVPAGAVQAPAGTITAAAARALVGAGGAGGAAPGGAVPPAAAAPGSRQPGASPASAASAPPAEAAANPEDLAPAVEPQGQAAQSVGGVIRATASGLPTYQDAAAEPGADLPSLKLDLHVYDPQPNQRFVLLEANTHMLRLREGDTTPEGMRVERITQDGVILSYRGKEFVLLRQ
jgi:general secretion pathway protein B